MVQAATPLASGAEEYLAARYSRLRPATKYLATFVTASGRHLALTRQAKRMIYLWMEETLDGMNGCMLKNSTRPGQPYSADQPRSSNLNHASDRLGLGARAFYVQCETFTAFQRLVDWYFAH